MTLSVWFRAEFGRALAVPALWPSGIPRSLTADGCGEVRASLSELPSAAVRKTVAGSASRVVEDLQPRYHRGPVG